MTTGVGLFAKPAVPGAVKTRLCPPLSPERAATLYRAFLGDLAERLDAHPAISWWVFSTDPEAQRATWPDDAPLPARWEAQRGRDLGERMDAAMCALWEAGCRDAVLVGSDHPTLPLDRINQAATLLDTRDLVLGPSLDGRYYLVAARSPVSGIFSDVPWSTPDVLGVTLERVRALGLRPAFLEPWFDVDRPEDLAFLANQLAAWELECPGSGPCPRTSLALEGLPRQL